MVNAAELNIRDLSLSHIQRLEPNVKRLRVLKSRVRKFERQCAFHKWEIGYLPAKPAFELRRLKRMLRVLSKYDLINTNSKIESIKKEINQWLPIKDHWKKATELDWIEKRNKLTDLERLYLDRLEEAAVKSKKHEMTWRLNMALEEALYKNWYVIFNTLTVNEESYNEVFGALWISNKQAPNPVSQYIKSFDKITGKENHQYYGVMEFGGHTGRRHFHFIHMLKEIPVEWKQDPNYGQPLPTKREINGIKKLWNSYGYSSPIAVRTTITDAWARLGFRWPVIKNDDGTFTPIKSGGAGKLANYVSKYILKSLLNKENQKCKPRIRQQLGMTIINNSIKRLTSSQLNLMQEFSRMRVLTIHLKTIPSQLLLSATHRYVTKLLISGNKHTQLIQLKARDSLMSVLRDSMRKTQVSNSLRVITSPMSKLKKQELFNIQKIFDEETINVTGFLEYPVDRTIAGTHSSTR